MDTPRLRRLLRRYRAGKAGAAVVLDPLRGLPLEVLGFALVDHHRAVRTGQAEVGFGSGKTDEQVLATARSLRARGSLVLVTRASATAARIAVDELPEAQAHPVARA